jgi:hypothetical protein
MTSLGFIILRHVNNEITNQYWQLCYDCIRKYYPDNHIIIIDDNSNDIYITEKKMYNITIIKSEYPSRGELLPYIYYLKYKLFDIACIIHDSVFIQQQINFLENFEAFRFIWEFNPYPGGNIIHETIELNNITYFNDTELINFYKNKQQWKGCFGAMCIISYDYLSFVNNKHPFSTLINVIKTRDDRMSFERIIACLFIKYYKYQSPLLGDIHNYSPWGLTFNDKHAFSHLPILKVWTSR